MNKLDKQLIEAINEWLLNLTDGYFQLSKYSMGDDDTTWNAFEKIKEATLEANKQSILKAIMERKPKESHINYHIEDGIEYRDQNDIPVSISWEKGYNRALEEFESVIKEILQTKTNE